MRTVEQEQDARLERVLPLGVQDALGDLAGAAKDGLLALSVGVGLGVLSEMMEAELDEVVGPKHAKSPERTAVRHGHTDGEVTLGGRRVAVKRPRARTADDEHEVPLETYEYFADRDPLTRVVLEQMLAGVSTRRFTRTREPVGEQVIAGERSASKSAVSREFVGRTREHLDALMSRDLADVRLAALMVDGIELKGRCCIVALGVSTNGVKLPLGLWDGSTENKTVTAHLLADLVARGLDVEQGVLVVLDGSKALRAAVDEVFGPVPVQPPQLPQREALAIRRHVPALDGRRDARGRDTVPQGHRLLRPREARTRRRTRPRRAASTCTTRAHSHHDLGGHAHRRHCVTITPTAAADFYSERGNLPPHRCQPSRPHRARPARYPLAHPAALSPRPRRRSASARRRNVTRSRRSRARSARRAPPRRTVVARRAG